jgi:HlyD family secretion protein
MRKFLKLRTLLILIALLVVLVTVTALWQNKRATAESYLTANVTRGDLRYKVSATGTMQAVITVQVGSQVSGRIQNLYADFNSVVTSGQVLARIDPSNFEAARDKAAAELATAQAAVKSAEATIANKKAELLSAKANAEAALVAFNDAQRLLTRSKELSAAGLIPDRDLETTQAAMEQAKARYSQAQAQINQIEAQLRSTNAQYEQSKAQVLQAQASLHMAEINLRYTVITSPIDGVVIERNVDVGQTVAASLQAPTLFIIAQDLTHMQVLANIDEADIGMVSENASVKFTVDAFPGETFQGKIAEVRLSSKTTQNVVTYQVIIAVDNPTLRLRPGMTANITLTVAQANNVLRVPNAALRFRPSNVKSMDMEKVAESSSSSSGESPEGAPPADKAADRKAEGQQRTDQAGPSARQKFMAGMSDQRGGRHGGSKDGVANKPKSDLSVTMTPGEKVHFNSASVGREAWQVVWVLDENKQPHPRRVKLGITDGSETAVLEGDLKEGDVVVVGETINPDKAGAVRSPFQRNTMPGGRPPKGMKGK